jgi:hypothetical protein
MHKSIAIIAALMLTSSVQAADPKKDEPKPDPKLKANSGGTKLGPPLSIENGGTGVATKKKDNQKDLKKQP